MRKYTFLPVPTTPKFQTSKEEVKNFSKTHNTQMFTNKTYILLLQETYRSRVAERQSFLGILHITL